MGLSCGPIGAPWLPHPLTKFLETEKPRRGGDKGGKGEGKMPGQGLAPGEGGSPAHCHLASVPWCCLPLMIDDSPRESQPLSLVLPLISVPPRGWDKSWGPTVNICGSS